ncbi:hypothetical protein A2U01_0063824, partial [Trifolium medium]|nr:hypothetical protein [Trifolium medium]
MEGTSSSQAKSIEEKKATETAATEVAGASEAKIVDKGKKPEATESAVKTVTEKSKGKPTKKPRTVKKRAARVQRKMIVHSDDSDEIEEDQSMVKRKRTEE